ncbi:phage tail protein [Devosia lacusdianchii]|uniref:phage tail protein n=1 Tax=Devosia lacusdianchii TaxID=2917991 RepID=UPI001F061102|nr:phage tail protein [Devosia sp. JXJ CY 41]
MGFLINIVLGLVLSLASTLLQQAFAPKPAEQQRQTGTRGSAQIGGKVPQYFLVGTVGEPGKLEYQNAWGNDGQVPNAYLTSVRSFGDLPIADMVGLFVNGVRVTLSEAGVVAQGYPVPEYSGNLWWKFFDGSQTAADSYLIDKFGGDADRAWASDMVGRGVPYLITTALWSETLWTGFPSFVGEFQGIRLYDPRQDSTVGGSGSQRWADTSTWAFSDNNMVIIYNIERGIHYGGARVWGGSATAAQLPYDVWAAAMDACDELVSLDAGGTEKRFRAGRRISLNERPADVIKELLIGCNGRIAHASDGTIYVLVGLPAAPDFAFTDADVLASEPLGSIPFPNLDGIINGATATYREPSQAWEDKETAPYLRSDLEAEDDGRQQLEGLDLGTTFSGTQAQRVIKAVIDEGRRFRTHVPALPPEYSQFRPLHVGAWTSERYGYEAKWFLITARTRSFGFVVFGLQEINPADHNWTPGTDEQPLSFAPVVTNRPAPQEVSGFFVEPAIALDNEGNERRPAFDVFWSSASVAIDTRAVRITMWVNAAADPEVDDPVVGELAWQGDVPPSLGSARLTQAVIPNVYYIIQIQYLSESGRATVASDLFAVRAPNVRLGPLDVVYGDIDLDELGGQIEGYFDWIGGNIRDVIEKAQEQDLAGADQELANAMQFDEMRRSLSVVTGDLSASFSETITVAIVPMQGQLVALADALTELSAANEGDVNTARIRFTAMSGPSGYSRIGIETRFDPLDSGDYRLAGSYWDTPNNASLPTRRVEIAQQFVIAESAAAAVFQPFIFESGNLRVANAFIANLTAANIQAGSITADRLNVTALSAVSANLGTVTAGTISLGSGALLIDGPNVRILVSD